MSAPMQIIPLLSLLLWGSAALAQQAGHDMPAMDMPARQKSADESKTLPNLDDRSGWPDPVADRMRFRSLLLDVFEYAQGDGPDPMRWDIVGWYGGDYDRLWFKTEGVRGAELDGSDVEMQLLYGRLIWAFFDFQAGLRYDRQWEAGDSRGRALAAIGLQGLSPYRFEVEPTFFLSEDGDVSARLTASQDWLLAQRLIAQPRIQLNVSADSVPEFGIGQGLNDTELGLRLRYEFRREFAPYLGVTWVSTYGETARLQEAASQDREIWRVVGGVRLWF